MFIVSSKLWRRFCHRSREHYIFTVKKTPSKRRFQHVTFFKVLSVKYKIEIQRKNEMDKKD